MRLPPTARAWILLSEVLDAPVAGRAVRSLISVTRVEQFDVDGVPVEIVRPSGRGPWPAWLFVNGAHPLRRREPVVTRLVEGLARAGFIVFVPDVPGLGDGTVTSRTASATRAVVGAAVEHRDVAAGRIALLGASTGAGLAILAAGSPGLAERVSAVAAVAPFADLRKLIRLTTTKSYGDDDDRRYDVTDLHRSVVARSLVATLADGEERKGLLAELAAIEHEALNPLRELPSRARPASAEARAILALLANEDAARFDQLYAALPAFVHSFIDEVSPLATCGRVVAPVEIVVPPLDTYFPPGEAQALAQALPRVRLTVTESLDHTRPTSSLRRIPELIPLYRFVVRGLAAAAEA
jgi:acetyl esterase/lipase